eukprot:TRINITY_DN2700_c0_g1_i1.p1 TRINITY_DN2700_c0_g1~~TRINITY_DN2700_c0_g1_i1.p1  ORF type:complete len:204 (+),score=43.98 TRINITY_DN2700_c0_g1_i1:68-679(+)
MTENTEKKPFNITKLPRGVVKVNVNDSKAIRHALDDKLQLLMVEKGYVADNWMSNWKIALGMAAIIVAILCHVVPVPFPENRYIVGTCCALYALFSGVMQLLISYVEKEVVFLSKPDDKGRRVRVRTHMPNFSAEYKVIVDIVSEVSPTFSGRVKAYTTKTTISTGQLTASIGQFFDDRGVLYTPGLMKLLTDVLGLASKKTQ